MPKKIQPEQNTKPEVHKHKKWHRINWATIESAYTAREELPTYADLAREFNISQRTLAKTAHEKNWVTKRRLYWEVMVIKTQLKLTEKASEARAKNIMVAQGTLAYLAELLKQRRLTGTVGDIDRIIRLIEYLMGNPDSRPDIVGNEFEKLVRELDEKRNRELRDKGVVIKGEIAEAPKLLSNGNNGKEI